MKTSQLFTKTSKREVKPDESKNYHLLVKAGFMDRLTAGVYTYLPLGLRVMRKIEKIIREEMENVGGQEVLMPALHPKRVWEQTGRWEKMDDLYRFTSYYSKQDVALGGTHEEVITPLAKKFISSYKDLPKSVFQIQDKFRDEKRAKSGILRGREFLMKDLYSFHSSSKDLDEYYDILKESYFNIFKRVGIGEYTYLTYASGGTFSKYSHEFQTLSEVGEDIIYLCSKCSIALNKEIIAEQKVCPGCGSDNFSEEKAIEVGNIFKLKDKFSKDFDLKFTDEEGNEQYVLMGCYGIGLGRLMGTIVEVLSDKEGIIWPASVAPYQVHLVSIGKDKETEKLYKKLKSEGIEVLLEDRDIQTGEKFVDADLIGVPIRVVVSEKSEKKGGVEYKERDKKEAFVLSQDELIKKVKEFYA